MSTESRTTFFAGVDWGSQSHQVCVIASDGAVLGQKAFPHSGEGLAQLLAWILGCADCEARQVAVAIEIPHGPVVDSLLDGGFQVFSINPKQLDRFRDRFSPAGAKDDRRDARVLADAVRTDPDCMRALRVLDAEVVELRELSRMADEFAAERTKLANRFREQLWRYYPQFLKLDVDLASEWALALWKLAPSPHAARRVRPSSVAKLLKKHRIRRFTADEVIAILRAEPMTVAPGVVTAAISHIRALVKLLSQLGSLLRETKQKIADIVETVSASDEPTSGKPQPLRDAAILASLPGVGQVVLATLLSEASGPLLTRDYQALRCLCGVAPVTRRSGKARRVVRRRASQPRLVNAIYHWSRVAAQRDPVSRAKYRALRKRGHTHGRALRSVGDRLLAVACAMLRDGTAFDPAHATVAA